MFWKEIMLSGAKMHLELSDAQSRQRVVDAAAYNAVSPLFSDAYFQELKHALPKANA